MKENGLGNVFLRHLVMAVPWGIIFLAVFFIAAVSIKQQVKEGVEYAIRTSIYETANLAFSSGVVIPVKQNIKEGIEFVARTAKNETKNLLKDLQVKQEVKEALEDSGEKSKK